MDLQEFLNLLPLKEWKESEDFHLIRCKQGDCPILSVLAIKEPRITLTYRNGDWERAARIIQLDHQLAMQIVSVSDGTFPTKYAYHYSEASMDLLHLRALIEDACFHTKRS